ncbi:hypothetical protein [Rubrivivax gelatinosus]|uniref:hypothetical protein n=1 Tax=Rubrivivax gelatinosus TaxID=28068 RepID=UPI0019057984|nr:hypothetical protein [Rubrivivax gelatinosus]
MTTLLVQLQLFPDVDPLEQRVQAILARRRATNSSGQAGEDIAFIRAALAKSGGGA